MKKSIFIITAILVLLLLASCTPGPNDLRSTPDEEGTVAGFWLGLWHGVIAPFTFVISLFSENVAPYDVHNNGGWYNAGFLLGMSMVFGGSGRGSAGRRR